MSEHIYLQLADIEGSSDREGHEGWIEVLSYSHGLSYSVSSGKDFSGAVSHSDLSIVKMTDAASHAIIEKINRRGQIAEITLEIWKDKGEGEGTVDAAAITIKLTNCRVSGYSMSGSDDGTLPVESVSFSYQAIEWTFPDSKTTDHDFKKPFGGS